MKNYKKFIAYCLLLFCTGCVEQFDPGILESDESILVIDGLVTDEVGPYTVKIEKSFSLNDESIPAENANVSIENGEGVIDHLSESSPGHYVTSFLQGTVGQQYRLNIEYEGKTYTSSWEELESSPTIDSVYFINEYIPTTNEDRPLVGVQFYINSHGEQEDGRYFRYEWEETWQYSVCFKSFYEYFGNDTVRVTNTPLYYCWKSDFSSEINLSKTIDFTDNILLDHKLGYIQRDDERFTYQYSYLIKQYTLNENEHRFWGRLKETSAEQGKLSETQPSKVVGNIMNVDDDRDQVAGYFSVSGLRVKRVKVRPRDVLPLLAQRPLCNPPCLRTIFISKEEYGEGYDDKVFELLAEGKFYYRSVIPFGSAFSIGSELTEAVCSDCRFKGGLPIKPDYWDE